MLSIIIVSIVLLFITFFGEALMIKSAKTIKEMSADKKTYVPFQLRIKRAIGIGLFIGGIYSFVFGITITIY